MTATNIVSENLSAMDCRHGMASSAASTNLQIASTDGELVIKRVFDAAPELVFKAWVDPQHVAHWFGPRNANLSVRELDVRPGGMFRVEGHCTKGDKLRIEGKYRELVEPDWIVFTDTCFVGESLICEAHTAVIFHEQNGKTKLTIHCEPVRGFDAFAQRRWIEGWSESLERLCIHLANILDEQCEGQCQ